MNIQEQLERAKSLLSESQKAIEDGNLELAGEKQQEAEAIRDSVKAFKATQDLDNELDSFVPEPKQKSIERPPFEEELHDTNDPDPEDSFEKSFYVLKYGTLDAAQKAVITDLYGLDYQQRRAEQYRAFEKFIRTGRLTLQDEKLLKTLILMPDDVRKEVKAGSDVRTVKATLQEGVADLGGYLVPEDYRASIIKRLTGMTVVRGRARQVTTIRDHVEWPKLEGGNAQYTSAVRVTWVEEVPASATAAETNPTWGMLRIPIHTVMARTDVSLNQLEDAAFNMLDILADLFAEAMAMDEDSRFLTGTGGGFPRGILGNRSGAEMTPEDGIGSVNSGNASAVTADGLIDLVYALHAQYRGRAVLISARNTHRDIRKLKDGNGDYLWQQGIAAGEPPTVLAYPFLENESMPAIAANAYPIIFGDLGGYMIADRVGMSIRRMEDTDTAGKNKVALFARRRLGGQVIEPWRFQVQKVSA